MRMKVNANSHREKSMSFGKRMDKDTEEEFAVRKILRDGIWVEQ